MGKKRNTPDGMALEKPAPHRVTSEHDSESRSTWVPRSPYSWAPYFGVLHFWTLHFWTPNPWALNPRLLLPAAFPNRPVPLHPISPMVFPVFTWTLLIFPFKIFVNPAYILIPHSLSRLIFLVTRFLTALWPLYPYICQIVPGILPLPCFLKQRLKCRLLDNRSLILLFHLLQYLIPYLTDYRFL